MASHAVNSSTLSNVYGKEKQTRNKKGPLRTKDKAIQPSGRSSPFWELGGIDFKKIPAIAIWLSWLWRQS
jgi:hypothetical protein